MQQQNQVHLSAADASFGGSSQPAAQQGHHNTEQAQPQQQQQHQSSEESEHKPAAPEPAAQAEQAAHCPTAAAGPEARSEDEDEDDEFDAELATWLTGKLSRLQPGAELTAESIKVLGRLLDDVTQRVLHEARQVSSSDAAEEMASTAAAAGPSAGNAASGAASVPLHERRGRQQPQPASALTSLDIHKVRGQRVGG